MQDTEGNTEVSDIHTITLWPLCIISVILCGLIAYETASLFRHHG